MMADTKASKEREQRIETEAAADTESESENENAQKGDDVVIDGDIDRMDEDSPQCIASRSPLRASSVDIECDGLLLKSQKANFDELTYLIRGLELEDDDDAVDCNENEDGNGSPSMSPPADSAESKMSKIRGVIKLGQWLQSERNQLIVRGVKLVPSILERLRRLSARFEGDDVMTCSIVAILFILHRHSVGHLDDVAADILIRFLPQRAVPMERVIDSLRASDSERVRLRAASSETVRGRRRRRLRRNRGNAPNVAMARDLRKCFDFEDGDGVGTDSVVHRTVGFVASFLLKEAAEHSVHRTDGNGDGVAVAVGHEIMGYLSRSAVLCKLALIVQSECVSMTERGEGTQSEPESTSAATVEAAERIESELVLMELITRNLQDHEHRGSGQRPLRSQDEGLLVLLDAVGVGLRFVVRRMTESQSPNGKEVESAARSRSRAHGLGAADRRFLSLSLLILVNITNERTVTLKPETTRSLFAALGRLDGDGAVAMDRGHGHSQSVSCSILAVLINLAERNRPFRARFDRHRVGGEPAIHFLVRSLVDSLRITASIEAESGQSQSDHGQSGRSTPPRSTSRRYAELKVRSFYISLLCGFLLQNTVHFKEIAAKMDADLTPIQQSLAQYAQWRRTRTDNDSHSATKSTAEPNRHSKRSDVVIAKIGQIVQLRMDWLKQQRDRRQKSDEQ